MAEYEAQGDGWTFNDASGRIDDDHPIVEATAEGDIQTVCGLLLIRGIPRPTAMYIACARGKAKVLEALLFDGPGLRGRDVRAGSATYVRRGCALVERCSSAAQVPISAAGEKSRSFAPAACG